MTINWLGSICNMQAAYAVVLKREGGGANMECVYHLKISIAVVSKNVNSCRRFEFIQRV